MATCNEYLRVADTIVGSAAARPIVVVGVGVFVILAVRLVYTGVYLASYTSTYRCWCFVP